MRYAVYETNGNLSVLENENGYTPSSIPVTIIVEGRLMETNFRYASVSKDDVIEYLDSKHLKQKDVLLMTIENTHYYIQPKGKPFFSEEVKND